jgi:parallel beta-helix repeat protein
MVIGDTTRFSATARDAKGNVLTGRVVTWAISDTIVATASPTGLVTALAGGTASVTATVDGKVGSVAVTVSAVTPTGTTIYPGQSIQAAVDAYPGGTAFVLKAGVHRLQQVTPKSGDTFAGEPGAVMSGARLLTIFTREGGYWVASGQTQDNADRTSGAGVCRAASPQCFRPENLFIDNVLLRHVSTLAEVTATSWYFDYAADKIYFAADPTGKTVETSVTRHAFTGGATNVTIRALVIEKYANPLQQGAVDTGPGWLIEDTEVRWNHGEGLRIATGARLLRNKVHHQGQLGIGGPGDDALVDNNDVYANNFAGVDDEFAAGGVKVHGVTGNLSERITLSNNRVHDNDGRGLWCDFNCVATVYEGNTVERNTSWGIEHEISYAAVIRNNTLTGNGGGIFAATSQDVEVANNAISGPFAILGLDQVRGTGYFGTLVLANLNAHDNTITLPAGAGDGQHVGVIQTVGNNDAFGAARNNRFTANHYTLSGVQRPFAWMNAYRTAAEWRGYGLDITGTFEP